MYDRGLFESCRCQDLPFRCVVRCRLTVTVAKNTSRKRNCSTHPTQQQQRKESAGSTPKITSSIPNRQWQRPKKERERGSTTLHFGTLKLYGSLTRKNVSNYFAILVRAATHGNGRTVLSTSNSSSNTPAVDNSGRSYSSFASVRPSPTRVYPQHATGPRRVSARPTRPV